MKFFTRGTIFKAITIIFIFLFFSFISVLFFLNSLIFGSYKPKPRPNVIQTIDTRQIDINSIDTQQNDTQLDIVHHERSNVETNNMDPSEPIHQQVDPYSTNYQYESIEDISIRYSYYIKNLEEVRNNFEIFLGRITENSTFNIIPNKKNVNTVEKIKKYLWGDNLWKVDSDITKDQVRLNRTESEKLNEKREVEILLENINLPNNIMNEILNSDFIYRLHPKVPETNLANKNTIEKLLKSFKNKFLIDLVSKIVIVKQEDLKLSILEKKVLLERSLYLKDTNTGEILENDFVFLDFRLTEISESEIKEGLKTLYGLTPKEIFFCKNYEFQIFENRLNSIINFLADEGLQIPDSMIDCITGEFILTPVLLNVEDTVFVNSTTKEKFIRDGAKNPFSRKKIFPLYSLNIEERKIHDDRSGEMIIQIDGFIDRLGERFCSFFDHLRDYNQKIQFIRLY